MKFTFFKSYSFEFIFVGFLVLVMLIPMAFITSLVDERAMRKWDALEEVSSKWGQWQALYGPIIKIPYREHYRDNDGKDRQNQGWIYIVPKVLELQANMKPETRHRGIYDITLYQADVVIDGSFDITGIEIPEHLDLFPARAEIIIGLTDLTGLESLSSIEVVGQERSFLPAGPEKHLGFGATAASFDVSEILEGEVVSFHLALKVKGTNQLYFAPLAQVTRVSVKSPWPDPSFSGRFLPKKSEISSEGFSARWEVSSFKTGFPHYWKDFPLLEAYAANFGVDLYIPVNIYQLTGRAAKYAILFLGLTFSSLLFAGIFTGKRVHLIQYGFVGISLSIFYLLLLSLSEHIGFNGAYVVSAISVIALITSYCKKILAKQAVSKGLLGILVFLYASLYFILQLEDYALLVGSVGLFLILAIIMTATAKVDWRKIRS